MRSRWMVCMLVVAALGAAIPVAAEQGVTDTEILLGGSNSFSGPLAFTGTQLTRFGVDLYFRVLNDAGGVHGRRIRTIYYDDGYRPQDAVANTRKLVEQDNIFAVIAPQGSPPVVAALAYLEQNKVPLLFPFQSSTETRNRKYVFSGLVLSDRQSRMMIDYLAGPRKFKQFAALYQDDEYGKSFLGAFEQDLGRHGLKLMATEPVKRGVTDVSAQIAKLQAAKPEVTFLVLTPGPAAQALQERQKIGWSDTLMVSTGPPPTRHIWLSRVTPPKGSKVCRHCRIPPDPICPASSSTGSTSRSTPPRTSPIVTRWRATWPACSSQKAPSARVDL